MTGRRLRLLLLGYRGRRIDPPENDRIVVTPSPRRSADLAAAGHRACIAAPDALPFRDRAAAETALHRSLDPDHVAPALEESARILADHGRLRLDTRVHFGGTGSGTWLLARLLGRTPPPSPDRIARSLVARGFQRIEQHLRGARATYLARRLAGRPRS